MCVCLFVYPHDYFQTSKHRRMKLGGRCIVRKSQPSLNLGVVAPWVRTPKCGVLVSYDAKTKECNGVRRNIALDASCASHLSQGRGCSPLLGPHPQKCGVGLRRWENQRRLSSCEVRCAVYACGQCNYRHWYDYVTYVWASDKPQHQSDTDNNTDTDSRVYAVTFPASYLRGVDAADSYCLLYFSAHQQCVIGYSHQLSVSDVT